MFTIKESVCAKSSEIGSEINGIGLKLIGKKVLCLLTALVLVFSTVIYAGLTVSPTYVYAAEEGYINDSGVRFRSSASTSSDSNIILTFPEGAKVSILDRSSTWYKVTYNGTTGYVYGNFVTIQSSGGSSTSSDAAFEKQIALFPDSYKPYLRDLHNLYPKWVFKPQATALKWSDVIAKETAKDNINLVLRTEPSAYRKYATQASVDSGGWVTASKAAVEYYMDPRNFLNSQSVFQFFSLRYDTSVQTNAGLKKLLGTSFISGNIPANPKGDKETYTTYVDLLNAAGKKSGVNPIVLAAMIIQEQGYYGKTQSVAGNVNGYEGFYNFFNVGAYQSGGVTAQINGLKYAKSVGWDSRTKAIIGGANFFGKNYVKSNQYTFYLKKYNVMNGLSNVGTHQYMGAIMGANSEAINFRRGCESILNTALVFEIPVYTNMPAKACPKPGTGTSSGTDSSTLKASITRVSGADRYKTSEAVAKSLKSALGVSKFNNIVLASGNSYPDALSATYLATLKKAPILLVKASKGSSSSTGKITENYINFRSSMDTSISTNIIGRLNSGNTVTILGTSGDWYRISYNGKTGYIYRTYVNAASSSDNIYYLANYIKNNLKSGGTVYIVGGTAVIPKTMESALAGIKYKRVAGADRYDTNLAVLKECKVTNENMIICSGENFPDALSAAALGKPILLVKNSLTSSQRTFLSGLSSTKYYIIGGTIAIPSGVETAIRSYGNVKRVAGKDRYETSYKVATTFFKNKKTMVMAYGKNYPDGLSAGPLAAKLKAPILMVADGSSAYAKSYSTSAKPTKAYVIGGTGVISNNLANLIA